MAQPPTQPETPLPAQLGPLRSLVGRASLVAVAGAVALGVGAAGPNTHVSSTPDAAAERLSWLAGCWEGTLANGALYEEVWLPPVGGTMVGMARMTRDAGTLSFEFMRITSDDEGVVAYHAQPGGREPTRFVAGVVTGEEVTFENPDHDFPQRIRYRLHGPGDLHARIEGDRDGQIRGLDFPLKRAGCPGTPEAG